ncbi:MAG: SGNH/GDSL hydrolase family protein [Planctomycetes bacterium]|nr:SGNH/GDSL hydrolase family protein [Planctomycetota bacterium]
MAKGSWLRRALLLAAAGLAALGAGEIGLRLVARLTDRERGLVYDQDLGWRMRPGLRKVGAFWSARVPATTNARGWRDAEHALAAPAGTRRVVALGDSFTFGVGADYGERFTEVLEQILPRTEVVNLGVNAFGPVQELRALEVEGLRYGPELVLLTLFLGNDLDDVRYERLTGWPVPWCELVDGELRLHPPRLTWDVALRNASYVAEVVLTPFDRWLDRSRRAGPWVHADTVALVAAVVGRIEAVARAAQARLLVVLAYPRERCATPPGDAEVRLRAALEARGVVLLDLHEPFARRAAEPLFVDDGHWSAAGHRLVAEAVAARLRALGWWP